ncbi:phosphatidylinositol phosphate synthase [Janibacter limosus]|jgi:CDP-diacylglycerol--glycerol-3-phosphate 3-phosphatidyltransferase|uniref:phosphatidylinositol phosphate synthase n=1 Tax=Janibacter limosus TaxID=53458 RepID=UPI0008328404|nr:CDP-alcohol phosphatidyltransferase family protein [Janibacter limosus]
MLNRYARAAATRILTPLAKLLIRLGLSPDAVTILGTIGVCLGAWVFFPQGELLIGVLVITAFVFSDTLDGVMARLLGRTSKWGAFLDSTLDRVGDAAIFSGLAIWFFQGGDDRVMAWLAMGALILGSVVSYARARAEGLGMTASVGIAERADRLVVALVTTGLVGLGLPEIVLKVVLAVLVVASAVTVMQRVLFVRQQCLAAEADAANPTP